MNAVFIVLVTCGIILFFLQSCTQSDVAYHEATSQDLVQQEEVAPALHTGENTSLIDEQNPLNSFAPPGVLENVSAKPMSTSGDITQVTATKIPGEVPGTPSMNNSSTGTDIKPFNPNEPVEPIPGPSLNEVIVKQSSPLIPKEIKLLVPEKQFDVVSPDNSFKVSYDDIDLLKVLNMDPVPVNAEEYFPDWLKELDGKRIRIRGYMFPTNKSSGITSFSLARDTGICCFGPNGKVYDLFGVKLRKGVTAEYMYLRPFDVVGVFHIQPEIFDDTLENIYYIDDAVIIK